MTPSAPAAPAPTSWLIEVPSSGSGSSRPPPDIVVRSLPAASNASRRPPNSESGLSVSKFSALSSLARAGWSAVTVTLLVSPPLRSFTLADSFSVVELTSFSNTLSASSTVTLSVPVTLPARVWEKTSSVVGSVGVRVAWRRVASTKAGTGMSTGARAVPLVSLIVWRCSPDAWLRSRSPSIERPRYPLVVAIWTGDLIAASATSTSRGDWRSRMRSLVSGREVMMRPRPLSSLTWSGHGAVPDVGSQSLTVSPCAFL